jgi:hypothetical protein
MTPGRPARRAREIWKQIRKQPNDSASHAVHDLSFTTTAIASASFARLGREAFTAYDADGQLIGSFQDKQAAVEAITAAST